MACKVDHSVGRNERMTENKKLICCIGDSLTEGDYGVFGKSGIANVQPGNYPLFLGQIAGMETRNFGKCGWRATDLLKWYQEGGFHVDGADYIVLLIGTNGGHSATKDTPDNIAYEELIRLLEQEAPEAKIFLCTPPHVTVNPAMSNCGYAPQVAEAAAFVRALAGRKGLSLIDLAADDTFNDDNEDVMQPNDGLHFSETGYRALASLIWNGIKSDFHKFRVNIWDAGEYDYQAAYGFEPNLRVYLHDGDAVRDAMLVVPGGGYCMVVPHEGECVAKTFFDMGFNVFVLTYTTDITFAVPLKKQPLKDVSRAVRIIRSHAEAYRIDPNRIIACGFSAGGHVCGTLATHWQDDEDHGKYAGVSNRPDGVILSYPVITTGEYTHLPSVWALIGRNASEEEMTYFSLEKQVSDKTPPCFVWSTQEDDLVPIENSYMFAESLQKNKIPHALYVFPHGGHGRSVCSENFLNNRYCDDYTFEQLKAAVEAVKAGKGVNVSAQRMAEIKEQFKEEDQRKDQHPDHPEKQATDSNPYPDIRLWPELAYSWIRKL